MQDAIFKLIPEFKDQDISIDSNELSYEFLILACFLHGARVDKWSLSFPKLPVGRKITMWCQFPRHDLVRFGKRLRRAENADLISALTPRVELSKNQNTLSVYYQGFPPLDDLADRPDWLIVNGKVIIQEKEDSVSFSISNGSNIAHIDYDTLLTKSGPIIRNNLTGKIIVLCIVEASTSKTISHFEKQLDRYAKRYKTENVIGVSAKEIGKSKYPILVINPKENVDELKEKGKLLFNFLTSS